MKPIRSNIRVILSVPRLTRSGFLSRITKKILNQIENINEIYRQIHLLNFIMNTNIFTVLEMSLKIDCFAIQGEVQREHFQQRLKCFFFLYTINNNKFKINIYGLMPLKLLLIRCKIYY